MLQITDNDLFYGGAHKDTFTVNIESVKELRLLLHKCHRQLSEVCAITDTETIEELEDMIEHIDEYLKED